MPRKPGSSLVGILQRVVQCGNNREPSCNAREDCRRYLDDLKNSDK